VVAGGFIAVVAEAATAGTHQPAQPGTAVDAAGVQNGPATRAGSNIGAVDADVAAGLGASCLVATRDQEDGVGSGRGGLNGFRHGQVIRQCGHRQRAACLQPFIAVAVPLYGANSQAVLIHQHQSATTDIVGGEGVDIVLGGPQSGLAGI